MPSPPHDNASTSPTRPRRTVIAAHLIHTLYGHWAVNDPRGSGSRAFIDEKFAVLGPIRQGRRPAHLQPTRPRLRAFHEEHADLLNFSLVWIDEPIRAEIAATIGETIEDRRYTCYACAICRNHMHLVIRTHRDRAPIMWQQFANRIRDRLRRRFADSIAANHPVISARPFDVLLYTPQEVWTRIAYVENNPVKDAVPAQRWDFVTPYDNWPLHKHR